MMLRLLYSTLLLSLTAFKCNEVSAATACSACGNGFVISLPDVKVTTNNGTFTCSEIQTAAASGLIPASQCDFIPVFIFTNCGCVNASEVRTTPTPVTVSPTKAPVSAASPTNKPVSPVASPTASAPAAAPSSSSSTCSICAAGQTLGNPNANVTIPNTGTFSCSQIEAFAVGGSVPQSQCSLLPQLATTCGCTGGSSTTTAPVAPSSAPITSTKPVAPISTTPAAAPTAPATPTSSSSSACSICPAGQTITHQNTSVNVPNTGNFTCSQIEGFAAGGGVPQSACSLLPKLAITCGCSGGSTPTSPSPATTPSKPSSPIAPIAPSTTPAAPSSPSSSSGNSCSICSSSEIISKPDVKMMVPNTGTFTCSQIQSFAVAGSVPTSQCSLLSQLATQCGCVAKAPSTPTAPKPSPPSTVTSESPTLAGTYPPTPEVTYKSRQTSAASTTNCRGLGMMLMTLGTIVSLSSLAV